LSSDEKTFVSTSSSLGITTSYVCDSETGHCISGPFESEEYGRRFFRGIEALDACFSPDGKHILVRTSDNAVVWEIERGEKVSQIEGFNFVFIHCGRNKGRIASMNWIYEDGPSIRTITSTDSEDQGSRPTHILRVKLWDIGNDISNKLFEVTDIAIAQFSPNGQYLAVGRRSENVVELWNLEDGESTHRFPYPPGYIRSLHFSPTSDCLMAAFEESRHKCLWTLDTQEMTSFELDVGYIPPVIIHSPNANRLFVPRDKTVEIWEVSMTGPNMIINHITTEPLATYEVASICPLRDGHRLLVGSSHGTVRMQNMEDLGSSQPTIQDVTDRPEIIGFSPSRKMVATISRQSDCVEWRDTATWEVVGSTDVEYKDWIKVAFSADDKRIAVLTDGRVTICDILHPESRLSFDPWPKGRRGYRWMAFQTCNDLVICTRSKDEIPCLLQVWQLKDDSECTSSLNININKYSYISLAPDGLTVITNLVSCYSWNHETAQFDRIHFTDGAHLDGHGAYSPDGKFFACYSWEDYNIRVWDTRTGQLCGKPITMPGVNSIALSPALNDQSLGDRLIAVHRHPTVTLFDVYTGHLYAQCWDPGWDMAFIGDGTKLASYNNHPIRIYDIVGLAAKHRNAVHGYEPVPQDMNDGWVVGQDDELLFWVPLEHRQHLCLPHVEMIWGRPTKVDLSRFRYGSKWTECIDQEWLNKLEESGKRMARLLE